MVIGWWATYPAEDVGRGVMVSDALGFHGFGRTAREGDDQRKTWPADLFAKVEAQMPPEQQLVAEFVSRFLHLTPEEYRAERFDPARFLAARPGQSHPPLPAVRRHRAGLHRHRRGSARSGPTICSCSTTSRSTASRTCS